MLFRVIVTGLLTLGFATAAQAAPPLEVFGRLPAVESLSLSPDGDRVAFVQVNGEQREVVVFDLARKGRTRVPTGPNKVRGVNWAGSDHLLITTSTTAELERFRGRNEWFQVGALNLKTLKYAMLLSDTPNTVDAVQGEPIVGRHRGELVAFVPGVTLKGSGSRDMYRVDLNSGRGRIHEEGGDVIDWAVTPGGTVVAREEHDDIRGTRRITVPAGAGWRVLSASAKESEAPGLLGLGRSDGTLLVSKQEGDVSRIHEMTIATGVLSPPLDGAGDLANGVIFDDQTLRPLALTRLSEEHEYQFLDPALAAAWAKASRAFKGRRLTLESWTPGFDKLVVKAEGQEDAGTYFLVDLKTNKADLLADAWPGVPPEAIAPVRWIRYKAADGLEIPAYLTLPPGRADAKNLPLIVLPHGGPQSRDQPGFDWWPQALASRGYAVLQPQFRGSDGFGRKFVEAGYGQWGRKMQTDLSDGVRHLATTGVVDAKRVCIMGASYGGYAAMAGPTLDPGVYRCAVAVAGVSNLAGMMTYASEGAGRRNTSSVRYWARFMGASYGDREKLDVVSPARQAAKADAPMLLIHGKDDTVVPYQQSVEMQRALQKAGKPVELVTLNGEDHWLSRGATRLQMLRSAVAFVEKHNPPN